MGIYIYQPDPAAQTYLVEVVSLRKYAQNFGEQDWEYKVLRDVYRRLGLPAFDPRHDP